MLPSLAFMFRRKVNCSTYYGGLTRVSVATGEEIVHLNCLPVIFADISLRVLVGWGNVVCLNSEWKIGYGIKGKSMSEGESV